MKSTFRILVILLLAGLAGCATAPIRNKQLDHYAPDSGYRLENIERGQRNSNSLFVILTFSGGGTRAASLSYGVMEKLRDTQIVWEGEKRSLLEEVDVISSVSGGSLTSAYYGLFRDRIFEDYAERVLYENIQGMLIKNIFRMRNYIKLASPFYGRTDLMADKFDKDIFEGRTFADLVEANRRPFIMINATDVSQGNRFEFTQDQFDLLYSDLLSFPVGYAVAASAAFPGLLTPIPLHNYDNGDDYQLPDWVDQEITSNDPSSYRYQTAMQVKSYTEPGRPYVHLVDGGVSDNLGLLPVIAVMMGGENSRTALRAIDVESIKKVVVITVNARRRIKTDWDTNPSILRLFNVLGAASSTPLGNFSQAQIEYVRLYTEQLEQEKRKQETIQRILAEHSIEAEIPELGARALDFHFLEVSFDCIRDEKEREYLNSMPTSFRLPKEDVDRLRKAAATALDNHPEFQELIAELR